MITKEIAISKPRELWHITSKNADGTPLRCRVNGKCSEWKREPDRFRLPIKYGLYGHGYVDNNNAYEWCLPDRHAIEQHAVK